MCQISMTTLIRHVSSTNIHYYLYNMYQVSEAALIYKKCIKCHLYNRYQVSTTIVISLTCVNNCRYPLIYIKCQQMMSAIWHAATIPVIPITSAKCQQLLSQYMTSFKCQHLVSSSSIWCLYNKYIYNLLQ